MLNKTLIDDYGNLKICRKWYASEGSHIIHLTGGKMVKKETTSIGTHFDEELGTWMHTAVWKDSPESGPRMEYAH